MDNLPGTGKVPPPVPVASPSPSTFVVQAPESMKAEVKNITKPVFKSQTLIALVFVFTFVSILIGIMIWILQYEISKREKEDASQINYYQVLSYPKPIHKI